MEQLPFTRSAHWPPFAQDEWLGDGTTAHVEYTDDGMVAAITLYKS
jgi:hypothetical protein